MNVTLEQTEQAGTAGVMVVRIAGRATVRFADELKSVLMDALQSADEVLIEVSGITEFDAAFLQLLCAAQKSAAAAGKVFHPGAGCSGALAGRFAEAGFPLPPPAAQGCATTQYGHGGDAR